MVGRVRISNYLVEFLTNNNALENADRDLEKAQYRRNDARRAIFLHERR